MIDVSFNELVVFAIIALVVLGPEKLPHAVRKAGMYYAKFRRTINTLKTEMEAELDLAETRQKMQEELAKIRQSEANMRQQMDQLRGSMQQFKQQNLKATSNTASDTTTTHTPNDTPLDNSVAADSLALQPAMSQSSNSLQTSQTSPVDDESIHKVPNERIVTRPWENMWFLLSEYDRAKRLPAPPRMPDYKAHPLLNTAKSSL